MIFYDVRSYECNVKYEKQIKILIEYILDHVLINLFQNADILVVFCHFRFFSTNRAV